MAEKKRTGRPPTQGASRPRVIQFRVTEALYSDLEKAAAENGRSVCGEAAFRLERSPAVGASDIAARLDRIESRLPLPPIGVGMVRNASGHPEWLT